ncbi:hypothetical protein Tco_1339167 [Tanacetum coccineum]
MDVWCNILKGVESIKACVPILKNSFKLKVCNGLNVSFWKDPWCGTGSRLKDVFPRLFALESHQDCKVNERWCLVDGVWGGNWEWRLPPRGRALNDLNSLLNVIGNLALSPNCSDKWSWVCDDLGRFNVKSISCIIQNNLLSDCILGDHHTWNSWIPCKSEVEDLDHCLINCPKVLLVWRKIWSWWCLDPPVTFPSFSISDIALGRIGLHGCHRTKKVLNAFFQCSIWAIWKWRNKVVNVDVDSVSSIKEEDIFS